MTTVQILSTMDGTLEICYSFLVCERERRFEPSVSDLDVFDFKFNGNPLTKPVLSTATLQCHVQMTGSWPTSALCSRF